MNEHLHWLLTLLLPWKCRKWSVELCKISDMYFCLYDTEKNTINENHSIYCAAKSLLGYNKANCTFNRKRSKRRKHFNVVLLNFWGCLNNYLADVISKAAITAGRRALHYQWGQQTRLRLNEKIRLELLILLAAGATVRLPNHSLHFLRARRRVLLWRLGQLRQSKRGARWNCFWWLYCAFRQHLLYVCKSIILNFFHKLMNLSPLSTGYPYFMTSNQKRKTPNWLIHLHLVKYFTKWIILKNMWHPRLPEYWTIRTKSS